MVSPTGISFSRKRSYHVREGNIDSGMDAEETNGDTNIGKYSCFERNFNFFSFNKVSHKKYVFGRITTGDHC